VFVSSLGRRRPTVAARSTGGRAGRRDGARTRCNRSDAAGRREEGSCSRTRPSMRGRAMAFTCSAGAAQSVGHLVVESVRPVALSVASR
jgi:hypothetical protein